MFRVSHGSILGIDVTILGRSFAKSMATTCGLSLYLTNYTLAFIPLEIRGLTNIKSNAFVEPIKPENRAENGGVSPGSYANAELMKIPNFLHLTKRHIKKHCDAIKGSRVNMPIDCSPGLCTKWPKGLSDEKSIQNYYPVEVVHHNYVFSSSNIRDPRARIVELSVPVSSLLLSEQGKKKLIRLTMGPGPGRNIARYDWDTDLLHLYSDRCPTSKQNADFLSYVLTVLTLECRKVEQWEEGRPSYDWLEFDWFTSVSRARLMTYTKQTRPKKTVEQQPSQATKSDLPLDHDPVVVRYRQALELIWQDRDLLRGDQWTTRPDPPRKRTAYPPIRTQPFEPLTGLDETANVKEYGQATRQLFGLSP